MMTTETAQRILADVAPEQQSMSAAEYQELARSGETKYKNGRLVLIETKPDVPKTQAAPRPSVTRTITKTRLVGREHCTRSWIGGFVAGVFLLCFIAYVVVRSGALS